MLRFYRAVVVVAIGAFCLRCVVAHAIEISKKGGKIDWSVGAIQETDASCGDFLFRNSKPGAMYSLLVKGGKSEICSFQEQGLVFHMPNDFGPTLTGKQTLFSFSHIGNDVYVAWVKPYD